jgi:hypothetical protein
LFLVSVGYRRFRVILGTLASRRQHFLAFINRDHSQVIGEMLRVQRSLAHDSFKARSLRSKVGSGTTD